MRLEDEVETLQQSLNEHMCQLMEINVDIEHLESLEKDKACLEKRVRTLEKDKHALNRDLDKAKQRRKLQLQRQQNDIAAASSTNKVA